MANTLGIQAFDYIEFYVGSAKMAAYWHARAMGFEVAAYRGPETGMKNRCSYLVKKNDIKIVLTSAIDPSCFDVSSFVGFHGDGVKRFAYRVDNVAKAYNYAVTHGAIPICECVRTEDAEGFVEEAAIGVYHDTEIVFVHYGNYKGAFKPGFKPRGEASLKSANTGLQFVDHIVGNVQRNMMDHWANYFNKAMDFETFVDFGPGDISTKYSALLSKVVRSKDGVIKHPINEPYEGVMRSQIEEYLDEYRSSGIQHIAIATDDIIASIRALRANGVEFLRVPPTYYDLLRKRDIQIDESIDELEELGILCDIERAGHPTGAANAGGYLLQLFTKPIGDRPTFFYEIIQRRRGASGFGQGNFQALFDAIELEQKERGNLEKKKRTSLEDT